MTDYADLKAAATYAAQDVIKFSDESEEMRAPQQFHEEVDPETILALIAENERLKTFRSTAERDLAQELEVWRNGPSCWSCGDTGDVHDIVGEWRGQCDCNAAKLINVSSERDQLKAENTAALRETTDLALAIWHRRYAKDSPNFQPFERASSVIGQIDNMSAGLMSDLERLKAENNRQRLDIEAWRLTVAAERANSAAYQGELNRLKGPDFTEELAALRKGSERYEWLRQARSGHIEVVEWIGPHATGMTGEDLDALLDAAMGKGELS